MKMSILVFILWSSLSLVSAQTNPILGKFSLSEEEGRVAMYWQILAGNTCNGIQIYRSTDSLRFSRIGYIGGICGSESEAVNYYFTDSTPVRNVINYYYLEFGGVGASPVYAIEIIDKGQTGYQIRPHPIQHTGTIYFDAEIGEVYTLHIYDWLGKLVYSAETSEGYFTVNASTFLPGSYAFSISAFSFTPKISGVFIVSP